MWAKIVEGLSQMRWSLCGLGVLSLAAIPLFLQGGSVMWITVVALILLVLGRILSPLLAIRVLKTLAERNRGFTIVDEGTAKIIIRGGGYERTLVQWTGYTLNEEDDVIPEDATHKEPLHPLGGLRHYGRPIVEVLEVLTYTFRRTTLDERGEVQQRENRIDYVPLRDNVYWCEVEGVDSRRVPLRAELVLTLHIKNPRKALFAVANWLDSIIARTQAEARNVLTQDEYDNWIKDTRAIGNRVYKDLRRQKILKREFEDRYGVALRDIEVRKIEVTDPSYRETTLQEDRATREKRAFEIKADLPAVEAGMLAIRMLADSRGVTTEEISKKLAKGEEGLQEEALKLMIEILNKKMAIDKNSYMEVNIPGGNFESGIGALLAAWKRMPSTT